MKLRTTAPGHFVVAERLGKPATRADVVEVKALELFRRVIPPGTFDSAEPVTPQAVARPHQVALVDFLGESPDHPSRSITPFGVQLAYSIQDLLERCPVSDPREAPTNSDNASTSALRLGFIPINNAAVLLASAAVELVTPDSHRGCQPSVGSLLRRQAAWQPLSATPRHMG